MKIFQIEGGFCYWDATSVLESLESQEGRFPMSLLFVEAPDYVFEGWGYDETKEGDERFIQPEPPEGYLYDINTGTYYPADMEMPGAEPTTAGENNVANNTRDIEQLRADVDYIAIMTGVELQ